MRALGDAAVDPQQSPGLWSPATPQACDERLRTRKTQQTAMVGGVYPRQPRADPTDLVTGFNLSQWCRSSDTREIVQKDELLTSHGVARRGAQRVDPGELLVQRARCDFYPRRSLAQDVRRQREGRRRPRAANPHAYSLVWEKDRRRTAVPPCPLAFRWPARAC